jgi:hypothetical protein
VGALNAAECANDSLYRDATALREMKHMIELSEIRPDDLNGDLASGVPRSLRDAFPDDRPNEGACIASLDRRRLLRSS